MQGFLTKPAREIKILILQEIFFIPLLKMQFFVVSHAIMAMIRTCFFSVNNRIYIKIAMDILLTQTFFEPLFTFILFNYLIVIKSDMLFFD